MNREIWLWLLLVMQPHNPRTMQIVEAYGNVRSAAEAIRDGQCELLTADERIRADTTRSNQVNAVIKECEENDIHIVTIEDEEYPELLRSIFDPPVVLFVQGSLQGLDSKTVLAVVGTRSCSNYAVNAAQRICGELAAMDIALVSGLAVGIDTVAHNCALQRGACTVGVLACGNLVDYPAASRELKRHILSGGGAVISELPPHTAVDKEYFKHRNRIISGLAHGTFVVEAPEISGCRFTAESAVQQGRELFCLPPYNIFSRACSGVVPFIRDGAIPVFGTVDIVNALKYSIFGEIE